MSRPTPTDDELRAALEQHGSLRVIFEMGYDLAILRVREDDERDAKFIHDLYEIVKALGFTGRGSGERAGILDALWALARYVRATEKAGDPR